MAETQPGGAYLVNGELQDANGNPTTKQGVQSAQADAGTGEKTLDDLAFTPAGRKRADELEMVASRFARRRPTGADGKFTVEDVNRIFDATDDGDEE